MIEKRCASTQVTTICMLELWTYLFAETNLATGEVLERRMDVT
jgi:hypothetical protein